MLLSVLLSSLLTTLVLPARVFVLPSPAWTPASCPQLVLVNLTKWHGPKLL